MEIKKPSWIPLVIFLIIILVVGIAFIGIKLKHEVKPEKHTSEPIKTPEQKLTEISKDLNETATSISDYMSLLGVSSTFIVLLAMGIFVGFIIMTFAHNRF
jgi:uncharacterized membrane protein SpoIIM required for sporulation